MIDIIKQTPREYSSQSRDYQVLARLYTILYNYSKMYIDNMQIWNSNIDNKLTDLRSRTVNFDPKHSWDLDDLESIVSCFKYIMRNKGTSFALTYCVDILMRTEGIVVEDLDTVVSIDDNFNVTIRIPENLLTLGIIEDLVRYLLPAGLTYDILEYRSISTDLLHTDIYHRLDKEEHTEFNYNGWGLDGMMDVGNNTDTKGNILYGEDTQQILNNTYVGAINSK